RKGKNNQQSIKDAFPNKGRGDKDTKGYTIHLEKEVHSGIKIEAVKNGTNISTIVNELIASFLDEGEEVREAFFKDLLNNS
ncbi:hypothetical protein, partial [Corynebacterium mastitidis]|uniref:hypothetical protein n=1 Tax=Corynebacterium mastitidis TaxID=161890 RepID=UPI001B7FAE65